MWRRMWGLGLVAAVATITGVLACRQLVGITDNPPEDLVTSFCGLPYGTNTCASCVNTNCCAQSTACAASAACDAYQTCVSKCSGDPHCRTQCMIADPGVAQEVSALNACLASNCETQCGLTCGSIVERLTPPDAGARCESCFQNNNACDTARACASSVDCDEYTRCYVACPTPDCREACATGHDAGAALFAPVQQVYANACSMQCAYRQNWNCVGHVVWPTLKASTLSRTYTIDDYFTTLPSGAGVDICGGTSCATCGSPGTVFGLSQTDDAGLSTTVIHLAPSSQVGTQSGFMGCFVFSSPNIVTVWGQNDYPQTEASFTLPQSYAAQTFTLKEVEEYLGSVGGVWDQSRAAVSANVVDCLGNTAPNVQVSISGGDSQTSVLYNGQAAFASNDVSDAGMTNSSGLAVFLNVPVPALGASFESSVYLTATPAGLTVPSAVVGTPLHAGIWTEVQMQPNVPPSQ